MTLATRCPTCSTAFRVVRDQLRVSEGWVRCGQCQEVFNALETLFDLESGLPPPQLEQQPEPPAQARASLHDTQGALPGKPGPEVASTGQEPPEDLQPAGGSAAPRETLEVDLSGVGVAEALAAPGPEARVDPIWEEPITSPRGPGGDDRFNESEAFPGQGEPDRDSSGKPGTRVAALPPESEPETENLISTAGTPPQGRETPGPGLWAERPQPPASSTDPSADALQNALPSDFSPSIPDLSTPPGSHHSPVQKLGEGPAANLPTELSTVPEPANSAAVMRPGESEEREVPIPAFVREADEAALDEAPRRRGAWMAAAGLLMLVALGQAAYLWRDAAATRWPEARAWLAAGCEWVGCRLEPWRQLSGLRVESSSLGQVGSTTIYQLTMVLRNDTVWALRAPALELALTDPEGRVVTRRVLSIGDLGSPDDAVPAKGHLQLQASLSTGDRRISGYTLELFYP